VRCSPAATVNGSTPGSPWSRPTTSPSCTPTRAGSNAITLPCSMAWTLPHSSGAVEGHAN
jgi:hypothetical protein